MKKFICLFIALIMVFSLAACSSEGDINSYVESEVDRIVSTETPDSTDTTTTPETTEEATTPDSTEEITEETTLESTEEITTESTEEEVKDPIIGYWVIDRVKFNNVVYMTDELKDLLNEEAYQSLQLAFEFTSHEVTIYINGENKDTTGYRVYEVEQSEESAEETASSAESKTETKVYAQYVDESGQLIFTLIDDTLQIEQSQSTLIFVKQAEKSEVDKPVETQPEESTMMQ